MPLPHEGESPQDPQSETVNAPHKDPDPPKRSRTPIIASGALLGIWIALGVALVVVALLVAF